MALSTTISEGFKLPLAYIVTDGSQAGNLTADQMTLLVGQMISSGTAVPNVPIAVGSPSIAANLFGSGSMLERMVNAFFNNNTTAELWCVAVPNPTSGVAATGAITITAIPTQSGVLYLYIAGQLLTISLYTTDTTATIATRLTQAINAISTLPVTALLDQVNTAKVNLTCKWTGDTGNDIQMGTNYLGLYGGQSSPVSFGITITPMSSGNGQPDFTNIIAAIQSQTYTHVGICYTDTASQSEWDQEYGFGATGRWNYLRAQYGWIYNAYRGDYSDTVSWGLLQNSKVISTMACEVSMPSPVWEVTAAYCAVGSYYLQDDPARPLQTLELTGILPALLADRYNTDELNTLTSSGLAVQKVDPSGNVMILREALQYQFNQFNQGDTAFALLTILSNVAALNQQFTFAINNKYPRVKLAPDGTKYGPGQAVVTPSIIKGELINVAKLAEYNGLLSDSADFIANLIVEIDDTNPNRCNILVAPQLMGQLRQASLVNQFRLLYNTNIISS